METSPGGDWPYPTAREHGNAFRKVVSARASKIAPCGNVIKAP